MEQTRENKMGYMPVPKLLITMSLPMMASMMMQALYNIVDSIFVARWSEDALTAVSLAFPMQTLMIAFATGTGVGMNALLSRSLGERNYDQANKAARNGMFLALCSTLFFSILGLCISRLFFAIQVDDPVIIDYGHQYLFVCMVFSMGIYGSITLERLLQSTGRTGLSMIAQMCGAITNIVLDPIMIFGLFGFPELGVRGAAIATVAGQFVGAGLALVFNITKNKEIDINMRGFRPHGPTIATIYKVGVPSIIMQAIMSLTTFCMDQILISFDTIGATVYGVFYKLQSFLFMPTFGLTNGMVPIVAFNYGARNKKRITDTIRLAVIIAVAMMAVGTFVFQAFPHVLLSLFHPSARLEEVAVPALRILSAAFVFAGYCIVISSVFQALGNGVYSLVVSVARQLLFILPSAYLFGKLFGFMAVWYSYPLAEAIAVTLCTYFLIRIYRQKIAGLELPEERSASAE